MIMVLPNVQNVKTNAKSVKFIVTNVPFVMILEQTKLQTVHAQTAKSRLMVLVIIVITGVIHVQNQLLTVLNVWKEKQITEHYQKKDVVVMLDIMKKQTLLCVKIVAIFVQNVSTITNVLYVLHIEKQIVSQTAHVNQVGLIQMMDLEHVKHVLLDVLHVHPMMYAYNALTTDRTVLQNVLVQMENTRLNMKNVQTVINMPV